MIEIRESEWKDIQRVAAQVCRRYPFLERADTEQELVLWMLNHEDDVRKWRDAEYGQQSLHRALVRAATAYGEREKAHHAGYELEDVHYYSLAQLQKLIPLALDGHQGVYGANLERSRSKGDPATGGDLMAMVADVKSALQKVSDTSRLNLVRASEYGFDYDLMTLETGEDRKRVRRNVLRSLRAVQTVLGGANPHREYTGQRKVMSRAQAQTILRRQENGQ